jgi:aspartate carbamoyltransferase catalytic subunit
MELSRKDILDMESLSVEEITLILDTADKMKEISERPIKKVPTLRGKTVVLFFMSRAHGRGLLLILPLNV